MSGQLVGEVIDASALLQEQGIKARAYYALVAIAEKASTHDRTASVRWDHIRQGGLYGASRRTAERAVQELIDAKLIRVAAHGFKNQHKSRAPIYEILNLPGSATQVAEPQSEDTATQVAEPVELDSAKSVLDSAKSSTGFRHPGGVLDVSLDVSHSGLPRGLPKCTGPNCTVCDNIRKGMKKCPNKCDDYGRLDDLTDCPLHGNWRLHPPRKASA